MDTSKIRAQRKAEREVFHQEWLKGHTYLLQGLQDLADGKTSIEELKKNPIWEKLDRPYTPNVRYFYTMAQAATRKDKQLISLILLESERALRNVWGDAEFDLRIWLEKNTGQEIIDLFKAVAHYPNAADLADNLIQGKISSHPLLVEMALDTRKEILGFHSRFKELHPELEKRAARKKPAKEQPALSGIE